MRINQKRHRNLQLENGRLKKRIKKLEAALEGIKDLSSLECRHDEMAADILIIQVEKIATHALESRK